MPSKEFLLSPYRALDLTDEKGYLAGRILADLGAEVIKIEPPGGDRGRDTGPFYHDETHREKSLFWSAFNTGKKSITLNLENQDGRELFRRLAKAADFVVESFAPGYLKGLGLDYAAVAQVNPRIIMASISPFGQGGPYRDFSGPDIVVMALSGVMNLTGDPDRPPVRISLPQVYVHAGVEAVVGILIVNYYRCLTGQGQYVDVSAQECMSWFGFHNQMFWDVNQLNLKRMGTYRLFGRAVTRTIFECKDGYVNIFVVGGPAGARGMRALVAWMDSEGMADSWLKELDWDAFDPSFGVTEVTQLVEELNSRLLTFFLTKTKAELFEKAVKEGFFLAPVNTVEDLTRNLHLESRGYWSRLDFPGIGATLPFPGSPVKLSRIAWETVGGAPTIGEHNQAVYTQILGLSGEQLTLLRGKGVI